MTPEYIRILRLDAAFVAEREEKMHRMDTQARRDTFAEVEAWFSRKYNHYNWRDWVEQVGPERGR